MPRTLKESPSFVHLPESPSLPLYLYPVKRFVSKHCFIHNFSDRRTKKTYHGSHRSSIKQNPHHRLWHMGLIHSPLARTQRLQKCHSPRPISSTISHLSRQRCQQVSNYPSLSSTEENATQKTQSLPPTRIVEGSPPSPHSTRPTNTKLTKRHEAAHANPSKSSLASKRPKQSANGPTTKSAPTPPRPGYQTRCSKTTTTRPATSSQPATRRISKPSYTTNSLPPRMASVK